MRDGEAGLAGWGGAEEGSAGARAQEIEGRRHALLGGGGGFSAIPRLSFLSFSLLSSLESVLFCAAACGGERGGIDRATLLIKLPKN